MRPPSVDSLANSLLDTGLPQPLCVEIAREAINFGDPDSARQRAEELLLKMLQPVINATGVLLHTNLGRAPLSFPPFNFSSGEKQENIPAEYTNLEFNLKTGERGSRQDHIGFMLARLVDAEAGLVVNNCSAAITLILAALAGTGTKDESNAVAVSRGELVEIGGGFRVPEVIAESGASLVEVGTTNRTRLKDYERAIKKHSVKLILKVHQSNYALTGFTESVDIAALNQLKSQSGKSAGVIIVADIGSGLLDSACPWLEKLEKLQTPPSWLVNEPAAKQTLRDGADLVAFSGDKLFGGPQAGIILGKADLIEKCAAHPLARAFRAGGMVISALVETTLNYLNREGEKIPFWKMATISQDDLKARAEEIIFSLKPVQNQFIAAECVSVPGGGTLPLAEIPSFGLSTKGDVTSQLRQLKTPIIARVQDNRTILDLRTVPKEQDKALIEGLKKCQP